MHHTKHALATLLACALFAGSLPALAQAPAAPDLSPRIAQAAQRLQLLQQRAGRVDDYDQLRNLQQIYGYYVDKAQWDQVVDLFAADGSLQWGFNGTYVGHKAIRDYLYSLTGGKAELLKGQLNNHIQFSPVITLAPDGLTARARWQQWVLDGIHGAGSGGNWGAGTLENEYVKENGVWKIRHIRHYARFHAPYEGGWTRAAPDTALRYGKSKLRPSLPADASRAPYPAAAAAPFHLAEPAQAGALLSADMAAPAAPPAAAPATVAELEAAVRSLELQLERQQAVDAVENLEHAYGYYADKSMQDAISSLFAENSTLEILGRGVFIGRDRVYEYMRRLGAPADGSLFNHMQLQPVIHVSADGNTAHARARLLVMFGATGRAGQWGDGIYENVFVKENGVWKYRSLMGTQGFYTDYDKGWARQASPMLSPFPGYPPDRPQSIAYDAYPAPFIPPYHYRNPVSGR